MAQWLCRYACAVHPRAGAVCSGRLMSGTMDTGVVSCEQRVIYSRYRALFQCVLQTRVGATAHCAKKCYKPISKIRPKIRVSNQGQAISKIRLGVTNHVAILRIPHLRTGERRRASVLSARGRAAGGRGEGEGWRHRPRARRAVRRAPGRTVRHEARGSCTTKPSGLSRPRLGATVGLGPWGRVRNEAHQIPAGRCVVTGRQPTG